jgi:hypothetical protein
MSNVPGLMHAERTTKTRRNHGAVIAPQKTIVNITAMMDRLFGNCRLIDRMGALGGLPGCGTFDAKVKRVGRMAAVLAVFVAVSGCSREDAVEHLKKELPVDSIQIIHTRFPCWSPDLHVFGYRFNAILLQQREAGYGDICWSFSTRQWSWQMLPDSSLARFNPKK